MENKKLTGYPSIDKPWLKYYREGAAEAASTIPSGITVWDFIEARLKEQGDAVPALEYFGKTVSRSQFIENVYLWARVFKGMGVKENEIVSVHGIWTPEICYIIFALNLIGAVGYYQKLDISKENLEKETAESRFAVALDVLWDNVKDVFCEERFEKVIVLSLADSMPFLPKIGFSASMRKQHKAIYADGKNMTATQAIKTYGGYSGILKANFVPERITFITSSSGTTVGGPVKGVMATNEAAISQIIQADVAEVSYFAEKRCLTFLSPTAATGMACAYFYPLYFNMVTIMEPRINENTFCSHMLKLRPQTAIMTGSWWEMMFHQIENDQNAGKSIDLGYFDMPILGGEGSTVEDLKWINELLKKCGSRVPMFCGYGLSETFSVMSVWKETLPESLFDVDKPVINSGLVYPGLTVGVFDKDGNELPYNTTGELWVKGPTMTKGYYNKPELTEKTLVDGWLRTGDIFEIDENGILYYYGRMTDRIELSDGTTLYMFDIVNELRKDSSIKYAMVNVMKSKNGEKLAVHLVLFDENDDKATVLKRLEERICAYLPTGIEIAGYKFHKSAFRASPTTAKKDRNSYANELDGYFTLKGGNLSAVRFEPNK